jgi:hypothetical protein
MEGVFSAFPVDRYFPNFSTSFSSAVYIDDKKGEFDLRRTEIDEKRSDLGVRLVKVTEFFYLPSASSANQGGCEQYQSPFPLQGMWAENGRSCHPGLYGRIK